jgi:hypothetical protein
VRIALRGVSLCRTSIALQKMTRRSFYMALYFLPALHVAFFHQEPAREALIHLHATLLR